MGNWVIDAGLWGDFEESKRIALDYVAFAPILSTLWTGSR
jgi:hypothetical protein